MSGGRVVSVVVHWNQPEETAACVASLLRSDYPAHEVVVADNDSRPEALARLREGIGTVRVRANGANLGYAGGNNPALLEAVAGGAAFVFLVNSDATVAPSAISRLVAAAEADERIGAIGPYVLSAERPERILYAGGTVDWIRGRTDIRRPRPGEEGGILDVDWIPGCAMLVRAQAVLRVGVMDPAYFLYLEEVDWCTRMLRAGFRVSLLAEPLASHREGSSLSLTKSPYFLYYYARNLPRFLALHAPRGTRLRFLPRYLWKNLVAGAAYYAAGYLKGRDRRDLVRARAQLAALRDALLRRSGRGPAWLDSG
ncbi:MAG: glycosyltransferase family 2 protein [Planctomycetes bacterium]|nr:glycosyltransferase family 2 protein [Planctomycetota bacterium]